MAFCKPLPRVPARAQATASRRCSPLVVELTRLAVQFVAVKDTRIDNIDHDATT